MGGGGEVGAASAHTLVRRNSVIIGTFIIMKHSIGHKLCMKCGAVFQTDLRGGAKWCFSCKNVVYREYQQTYKRRGRLQKEQNYALN